MSGGVAFMGFCEDKIPDGEGRAQEDLPGVGARDDLLLNYDLTSSEPGPDRTLRTFPYRNCLGLG